MSYFIRAISNNNFVVEKDNQHFYHMDNNWLSTKANATIGTDTLAIESSNFWKTKFNISYSGMIVGKLHFNWKSHGLLDLVNEYGDNLQLTIKRKGLFNIRYEVYSPTNRQIISLHTSLNWFKTDYEVQLHDPNFDSFPLSVLVGILGFTANKIKQRNSGS